MKSGATVSVFPAWQENPYLNLLALAPAAAGYRFVGRTTFASLMSTLAGLGSGDTLHIHWTAPIAQTARNAREADRRVRAFQKALDDSKRRGAHLIWTVHNRLPHELNYLSAERKLYKLLADRADAIHIMAPSTAEVISDVVALPPATTMQIPHPSYAGIYDSDVSRATARESFGIDDDEYAVLFLGQVRPYKGIDVLLEAIAHMRRDDGRKPVLLLAGAASPEAIAQFEDLKPPSVRAITHFSTVPDGEIARWYRAADIAVFPYRAILNSGSMHLAATMEIPAVLPDLPHLREQFNSEPWVGFFDVTNAVESLALVLSSDALVPPNAPAFSQFTKEISPWQISTKYHALLNSLAEPSGVHPVAQHNQ